MPVNDLRPSPHISTTTLLTLTGNFTPSICTSLFDLLPCLFFFTWFLKVFLEFPRMQGWKFFWSFYINDAAPVRSGRSKNKENNPDSSGAPLRVLQQCR